MKVVLLISCMHQKDTSIIKRSNVQTDVVVVNQCDSNYIEEFDFLNKKGEICHAKFIHTTERGLSRSRNLALKNTEGDICQICDDDELMAEDGSQIILEAYAKNPEADVITFALTRNDARGKRYPGHFLKMGIVEILRTSSQQITFRRNKLLEKQIWFDEMMGSGTGNGGGEENKLLIDCKKKGLNLFYSPGIIATINPGQSQWFHGYTSKYFRNTAWANRRILGLLLAFIYMMYWCMFRQKEYRKDISVVKAVYHSICGLFEKKS